ncbi:hypothetical protein DsansV1_C35g0229471 [Dioscorea sansibarensis]
MASGTRPILVIFIIFSILLLLFINTQAAFAAHPISIGNPLNSDKPVCGGPRSKPCASPLQPGRPCRKYYHCYPPASNNIGTRSNIKTNN